MDLALSAARWVVGKALAPVTEGLLGAWAASENLGAEIDALTTELHYAQALLSNTRGREIHNPGLDELLLELRLSAYGAEDVLDELDYFRIQDEIDGTSRAAGEHAGGCAHGLLLHARATARCVSNKLNISSGSRRRATAAGQQKDDDNDAQAQQGCMPKAVSAVGLTSKVQQRRQRQTVEVPKLKFHRIQISKRMTEKTQKLKSICAKVSTILNLELLGSKGTTTTTDMVRPTTTDEITEPKLYGRETKQQCVVDTIIHGECCANELTVLPIVGPVGIGKTTFAQHVYKEVKSHFQVNVWICVSLNFNTNRLAREVREKMPKVNDEKEYHSDHELIE